MSIADANRVQALDDRLRKVERLIDTLVGEVRRLQQAPKPEKDRKPAA